ncbi:MAG: DinB family protein [Chloroflexota bacterium]
MNLDAIRRLYAANEALHLKLWACIDHLSDAQFVREVPYGIGSVRNHMIHLASVDQRWMARVTGAPLPDRLRPDDYPTNITARAAWDDAQARVRATIVALSDADLTRPVTYDVQRLDPPQTLSATSAVWQVLVHVLNHGTDHRAQVLRLLYEFGAPTFEQDWMIYWWDEAR